MKAIVMPLTKAPHRSGRYGRERFQDWYRGCVRAVELERKLIAEGLSVEVLVLSGLRLVNEEAEADVYVRTLRVLGAQTITIVRECFETVSQIEFALARARRHHAELHIVSTLTHYLRVRWLLRNSYAACHIAVGIPRPREIITDSILTVLFPVIDLAGRRSRWVEFSERRRRGGAF